MRDGERIEYEVIAVTSETERAWLVQLDNGEFWLPKSQCSLNLSNKGIPQSVSVPEWLAIEEGIE